MDAAAAPKDKAQHDQAASLQVACDDTTREYYSASGGPMTPPSTRAGRRRRIRLRARRLQVRALVRDREPLVALVCVRHAGQRSLVIADRRDVIGCVVQDECRLAPVDDAIELRPGPDCFAIRKV